MVGVVGSAAVLAVDFTAVSATVATSATAVIVGYLGYKQHRADNARVSDRIAVDRQQISIDGMQRLIDQLQEQLNAEIAQRTADRLLIAEQSTELGSLRRELADLHVGVIRLTAQLVDNGLQPLWEPNRPRRFD